LLSELCANTERAQRGVVMLSGARGGFPEEDIDNLPGAEPLVALTPQSNDSRQ
jgi:hypothetical protein